MRKTTVFWLELAGFVALFFGYGLVRFRLGIDLTDEGAYLAWPWRIHLGEARHSSELLTLIRPIEVYLSVLFDLKPSLTLLEARLVGWSIHIAAFVALARFLFELSAAPLRSLLTAAIPFFICHVFGWAIPSYNTLSSDFLCIALSLFGIATLVPQPRPILGMIGGVALFISTLAHPGLGLVPAFLLCHQLARGGLLPNGRRQQWTPLQAGLLATIVCWLGFVAWFWASGDFARWWERLAFSRAIATSTQPLPVLLGKLLLFPFLFSKLAVALAVVSVGVIAASRLLAKSARYDETSRWLAATIVATALLTTFSLETNLLPLALIAMSLLLSIGCIATRFPTETVRQNLDALLLAAWIGAFSYATLTYYFNLSRSWTAGLHALPFAFGTAFTLFLGSPPKRAHLLQLVLPAVLALVVLAAARNHFRDIYRDCPPEMLVDGFTLPKLRGIRSTPERVATLNQLSDYLTPRLQHGEPLLSFDDCPLLYYLFDARPAYGLAWAVRYGQSAATLRRLDAELRAKPLPRYAIRALVDVSAPSWRAAALVSFEDYPLNETVTNNYRLEYTVYPFEVWRLKAEGEKASSDAGRN